MLPILRGDIYRFADVRRRSLSSKSFATYRPGVELMGGSNEI
jgi:hypothetical protein